MNNSMEQLPDKIKTHLEGLLESTELPRTEESLGILAENWIARREMFSDMLKNLSLEEIATLPLDDNRAALVLTYSGSLLGLGPKRDNSRSFEYASIKLRSDVPGIMTRDGVVLKEELGVDRPGVFQKAPIKSTSGIYKIAVCAPGVDLNEQEKRIKEAMLWLTNAFVLLNRKSFTAEGEAPDQFNLSSMVKFTAGRNGLTQKQAKALISDFLLLAETGMLLGERVSLGRLGKIFLTLKPPRKPRVMKNRFTGQEMTIPAKPERYAPKISFPKKLKERAAEIQPKKE